MDHVDSGCAINRCSKFSTNSRSSAIVIVGVCTTGPTKEEVGVPGTRVKDLRKDKTGFMWLIERTSKAFDEATEVDFVVNWCYCWDCMTVDWVLLVNICNLSCFGSQSDKDGVGPWKGGWGSNAIMERNLCMSG